MEKRLNNKHKLWVEKYRPTTLNEYIFHDESHERAFRGMVADKTIPHLLLSGVQGSGKAQPLTSKILTPSGWKLMGELSKGDTIITPSGRTSTVQQIFSQGIKDIYRITFHDGSSTRCCINHLWECYFFKNTKRKSHRHIIDTKTIIDLIHSKSKGTVSIPLTTAVEFPHEELPIDPYVLGVLIGDGSLLGPSPKLTSNDTDIINQVSSRLIERYHLKLIKNTLIEYILSNRNIVHQGIGLGSTENEYTNKKFIPTQYKRGTSQQRWRLIRGLMDTDGTIGKKGNVSFTTVSYTLAHEVQDILWSLGCTCSIRTRRPTYMYNGEKKKGKLAYTLHTNHNNGTSQFFNLTRKKNRDTQTFAENHNRGNITLRRRVVNIELVSKEEARCILVDDPEHLYITDDYIVTHNTTLSKILVTALEIDDTDILIINSSDENSVDTIREKIKAFITTFAMSDFKVIQLEEADYITSQGQGILRMMMEEYSDNARFILTCNYENKIIPPIKSRCQHFRFKAPNRDDVTEYAASVLISEKVKFDLNLLDMYISAGYPDIRKIVNMLQQNVVDGKLEAITAEREAEDYKFKLLELIERDKWQDARMLACANVPAEEWEDVYRFLYDNLHKAPRFQNKDKWEEGIVIIAEHLYKHSSIADGEINAAAMFIRLTK